MAFDRIKLHEMILNGSVDEFRIYIQDGDINCDISSSGAETLSPLSFAIECYLADEPRFLDKKSQYLAIILLLINKNADLNQSKISANLTKLQEKNPNLKQLISNFRTLNNYPIDDSVNRGAMQYAIGLNYEALGESYEHEALGWFEKATLNNDPNAIKKLINDSTSITESKISPQRIYNTLFTLGRISLQKNIKLNIQDDFAINYFLKAKQVVAENKDVSTSAVDRLFLETITAIANLKKTKTQNFSEIGNVIFRDDILSKLIRAVDEKSEVAFLYLASCFYQGSLEQKIFIGHALRNGILFANFPDLKLFEVCKKIRNENKHFIQGLKEMHGMDGCPVNERKAIVNFNLSAKQANEAKQIEHAAHSLLYVAECQRRLAEKARANQKNPEERLSKAIKIQRNILSDYKLLQLETREHIFFSLFQLLKTAIDKREVIFLILDGLYAELNASMTFEPLLTEVFNTLFSTDHFADIEIWKTVVDHLNCFHEEIKNKKLQVLLVNQLTRLNDSLATKQPEFFYYIQKALGDCYSRIKTKESLVKSINHYEAARKQHALLVSSEEKFAQTSYCHVYKDLGDVITQLREKAADPILAEELRKEAIDAYNTATILGDIASSLNAARLIELDGEGTDDAISKYQTTMNHAAKSGNAKQIIGTLDEIRKFITTNDLEKKQMDILNEVISLAFNKLNDPLFIRSQASDCKLIHKKLPDFIHFLKSNNITFKAYDDYHQAAQKFIEYKQLKNFDALKVSAEKHYPPAVLALLEYNTQVGNWVSNHRVDRPLYLCAKLLLLSSSNLDEKKLKDAQHFLDIWANKNLDDYVNIKNINYQRILIARFYNKLIAESRRVGLPIDPDTFILKRAIETFKNEEALVNARIEMSIRKANHENTEWIKKKCSGETGVPVLYSHPVILSARPDPVAPWANPIKESEIVKNTHPPVPAKVVGPTVAVNSSSTSVILSELDIKPAIISAASVNTITTKTSIPPLPLPVPAPAPANKTEPETITSKPKMETSQKTVSRSAPIRNTRMLVLV